jgi:hypothetical protein
MGGQLHAPALLPSGSDPVPAVHKDGWEPGQVRTYVENIAPTGMRSPDRSESLYQLSYHDPRHTLKSTLFI